MATVREVTYDLLRELGMTTVFGNPGSTELPFLADFPDDFRYVLGLQEATALGMAEGYARGTGRATLVNLHTSPGVGNALGTLVTAWHNKIPLVVTAGQQDRRHVALEPLLTGKLVEFAKPYVKRSHEPLRAEDVPCEIQRAYHTAMQPPQGPVFVSIPMNDWEVEAEKPPVREVSHRSVPDPDVVEDFANILAGARSPAVVAGAGVARAGAFYDAVALVKRLRAEVWADANSPLVGFPRGHPLFRGHLAFGQQQVCEQLSDYDVVLVLGTRVLQVTEDPEEARGAAIGSSAVGDVGLGIRRLTDLLPEAGPCRPPRGHPRRPNRPRRCRWRTSCRSSRRSYRRTRWSPTSSASSKAQFHQYVHPNRPGGYLTSAAGGLGYCLPAAVGLKLAQPERTVVCVIGDGSLAYSIQALWSAARYRANVPVVVIDNRGYSILKGFRDAIGIGDTVPGLDSPTWTLHASPRASARSARRPRSRRT